MVITIFLSVVFILCVLLSAGLKYGPVKTAYLLPVLTILTFGDTSQKRQLRKIMANRSVKLPEMFPPLIITSEPRSPEPEGAHRNNTGWKPSTTGAVELPPVYQDYEGGPCYRDMTGNQPASYLCTTCKTKWGCAAWARVAGKTVDRCVICSGVKVASR